MRPAQAVEILWKTSTALTLEQINGNKSNSKAKHTNVLNLVCTRPVKCNISPNRDEVSHKPHTLSHKIAKTNGHLSKNSKGENKIKCAVPIHIKSFLLWTNWIVPLDRKLCKSIHHFFTIACINCPSPPHFANIWIIINQNWILNLSTRMLRCAILYNMDFRKNISKPLV